jgi:hypothetical protein
MKNYRAYAWMIGGALGGFGLSFVIPGLLAGAGIAIGTAVGLAISTEGAGSCHLPWRRRSEDRQAE